MSFLDSLFSSNTNNNQLKVGDYVYIKPYGDWGVIIKIVGDEVWVDIDEEGSKDDDDTVEIFRKSELIKK